MKPIKLVPKRTRFGWQLNIPAALSSTGKRRREYYATNDAAEKVAGPLREKFRKGDAAGAVMPRRETTFATDALAKLTAAGFDPSRLIDAAEEYIQNHNRRLQSVTFKKAFDDFEAHETRSPSYKQSLRQYRDRLTSLHDKMLCDVGARDLEHAMKDFKPSVYNFGLRILGGLFNYGRKRDLCESNPVSKMDRKKRPPTEVKIYTPKQTAALLRSADDALLPWLAVCTFAGLRASEARQITWADVDLREGFLRVPAAVSKTRTPRSIKIESPLRAFLTGRRKKANQLIAPQGANVLRKQLRAAHKTAKVAQIKHGPRHCFASYLLARDGDVDALLLAMGHTEADTTFRHYHRVATKRDALAFWAIRPKGSKPAAKPLKQPQSKSAARPAATRSRKIIPLRLTA